MANLGRVNKNKNLKQIAIEYEIEFNSLIFIVDAASKHMVSTLLWNLDYLLHAEL